MLTRLLSLALFVSLLFLLSSFAVAESPQQLDLRVKVALALSVPSSDCGDCKFDEAEARAEAMRDRKPLALLVGECGGLGKVVVSAGGVPCIVKEYDGKTSPRIVILEPMSTGDGWYIHGELPAKSKPDDVKNAIGEATPKPPQKMPAATPLNWYLSVPQVKCPDCRYR